MSRPVEGSVLIACWSVKGGSGASVVAATLALLARSAPEGALLVDLAGDQPAILGLPGPEGPGVAEWLRRPAELAPATLHRLEVDVDGLALLPRGSGALAAAGAADVGEAAKRLVSATHDGLPVEVAGGRTVVVDCGTLPEGGLVGDIGRQVAEQATRSFLVTRSCYLGLQRAVAAPLRPSGVVLIEEPGRALRAADVVEVLGVDLAARVPLSADVARAVDAGLLAARLPRCLRRNLRELV